MVYVLLSALVSKAGSMSPPRHGPEKGFEERAHVHAVPGTLRGRGSSHPGSGKVRPKSKAQESGRHSPHPGPRGTFNVDIAPHPTILKRLPQVRRGQGQGQGAGHSPHKRRDAV